MPSRQASALASLLALGCAGCFDSHGTLDAGADVEPLPMPPPVPPPDPYDVGPAPGEGVECPALPAPPARCAGGGGGFCDPPSLRRALADARAGDVVRVGACRVTGSFSVPEGVTLTGTGPDTSVIVAPFGRPAVLVAPSDAPTVVSCLAAEANGAAAVSVAGGGEARAEHLTIRVSTGIGLSAVGVGRLSMHDLEITGPVREDNADEQPLRPTLDDSAMIGLELAGVGEATAYRLSIRGFADAGLSATRSDLTLRATDVSEVLTTNLRILGGHTCVRGLSSDRALQGTRLLPPYGLVVAADCRFVGADVSVTGSGGYAILQDGAYLEVEGLTIEDSAGGGFWIQRGSETQIRGARIVDNRFAGVRVCEASSVSISDAEIRGTRVLTRIVGTMPVDIGAGILLGDCEHAHLANLDIGDNDTVGLVVDLGAALTAEIDDVRVMGPDRGFGALAFDDLGWVESGGWDEGITREGPVAANDLTDPSSWPPTINFRCSGPLP